MTPQELKNSILQLAIQGRLVEQRPEEGTGEELYQQIQKERQALIKAGKIKKGKPLPEIAEDEMPFEIPETWKWVRFGDCTSYAEKKEKVSAENIKDSSWSLDLEDIEKGTGKIIDHRLACNRKINGDKVVFHKGQILYSKLRPYLKKILVAPENGICTPELVPFDSYGGIIQQYMVYVLKAPHVDFAINAVTYGIKMPRVGTETMVNLPVPLPPLAEQKRIVSKIEELLPLIDRYEQAWTRLEDFNKRFPMDMQKSILQMAIQGKLVEQRPEEGTGEELYQQIQREKQALIQAGKLKKQKPLPEIAEDEVPFEIPETWKWVRVSELAVLENGDRSSKYPVESDYVDYGIPFIGAKDIDGRYVSFANTRYITEEKYCELGNGKLQDKDIICLLRGSVGKCAVFAVDEKHTTGFICAQMIIVRCIIKAMLEYVFSYFQTPYYMRMVDSKVTGTAVRQLPGKELGKLLVPLPPLAEQKRIVARLQELLPLCEGLK